MRCNVVEECVRDAYSALCLVFAPTAAHLGHCPHEWQRSQVRFQKPHQGCMLATPLFPVPGQQPHDLQFLTSILRGRIVVMTMLAAVELGLDPSLLVQKNGCVQPARTSEPGSQMSRVVLMLTMRTSLYEAGRQAVLGCAQLAHLHSPACQHPPGSSCAPPQSRARVCADEQPPGRPGRCEACTQDTPG